MEQKIFILFVIKYHCRKAIFYEPVRLCIVYFCFNIFFMYVVFTSSVSIFLLKF